LGWRSDWRHRPKVGRIRGAGDGGARNADKDALAEALGFGDDQILTFTQPVGYPR
jgi:hypothetical protein